MFYKLLFALYFTALFSFLLFINLYYLEGIPHVPDEAAYLFMAKIFATGHIMMPIPISPEHFNFFPGILSVEKGTWLFQYPFGHPLLLSMGILLGFPNIIPPLVGTLFIIIVFFITKEVFDKKTAIFVLPFPFLSPFFLENAASFMSHNTASFYLACAIYTIILSIKSKRFILLSFISGIFIGLLFNTRPLTSLPFLMLITIIIVFKHPQKKIHSLLNFFIGFIFLFLLWITYNYITTGNALISQYYFVNKDMLPFENQENPINFFSSRMNNTKILFNNLGPMLFNWSFYITYGLLFIPFITRKNTFWDNVFFLSLFTLPIAYFFYNGTFLMYGPRFWYEILPFVLILTARGLSIFYTYKKIPALLFFSFLITLSFLKLFSFIPTQDPDYFSLVSLPKLKGFNFTDARIINEVKIKNIHNAVIFIQECNGNWWCYGSVFPQNSPTLDTDIVYLKNLGDYTNQKVMRHFQGRSFYLVDYYNLDIKKIY